MNATIAVPVGGGCFEGHFPGRPILPGVALLELAREALAGVDRNAAHLRGIAFARLRQPVAPGDRLELTARVVAGGQLRIDLRRGEELVANAQLVPGMPDAPPPSEPAPELGVPGLSAVPDLDLLLPHRPPMRLITSVAQEAADGLVCTARVPPGCGLAREGAGTPLAGVEAAAQAAAVWEALRRWRAGAGGSPRIGYLVAIRDLMLFARHVAVDAPMLAAARLEAAAPPLTHYRIETWAEGKLLLRGTIATYLS